MKFRHFGKPSFEIVIDDEPVVVMEEVGEFLLLDKPDMVYAVDEKGEEVEYGPFKILKPESFRKEVSARLEDLKKDLDDDGKLNYSHDPNRKSPGRKKKGGGSQ